MKKFLRKALGLVTLATVVPVNITHDEITGKTTYQSLLASLTVGRGEDGMTDVGLNMGEGVLTVAVSQLLAAQKEAALFADYDLTPAPAAAEPLEEDPFAAGEPSPEEVPAPEEAPAAEDGWATLY